MEEHTVSLELGGQTLTINTGKWAKLAGGSAVVRMGDTVVLVASSAAKSPHRRWQRVGGSGAGFPGRIEVAGSPTEIVKRHEIGHCNVGPPITTNHQ
jgi:hypothetical protein